MVLAKNSSRSFCMGLAMIAAGLFVAAPASAAKVKRLRTIGAKVHVPNSWVKTKVKRGKKVTFSMRHGGKFSISYKKRKLPLTAVARAMKKSARKNGWRLLEQKRNIRQFGKRAHLLVYEVPTGKRRVKVRAAFFFVNTANGYYTLYFGTKRKHFRKGLYKAVYTTFNTL